MRAVRTVPLVIALGLLATACGSRGGSAGSPPARWHDRDAGVFATTIEVVVDEVGTGPPPVVFVVDRLCGKAGQTSPSKLACQTPIPDAGRISLAEALGGLAPVDFVADPASVADENGGVQRGGLVVWLGPTKDEEGDVRVGANYATGLTGERAAGVNLRMAWKHEQWIVTGSAGLGGCPA